MAARITKGSYPRGYSRTAKWSDVVGIAEIADELELERNTVGNWAIRWANWPRPLRVLESGAIYSRQEVLKVLKSHNRIADTEEGGSQ